MVTIGSFLLTIELFAYSCVEELFTYNWSAFAYSWSLLLTIKALCLQLECVRV